MQFVTTKQHRYRGKMRKIGDTYEIAGKSDARLVQALGWSIPAPVVAAAVVVTKASVKVVAPVVVAPVESPAPVVVEPVAEQAPEATAEAAPEPESVAEALPDTDKPKRTYKRRDLSAE